MGQPRPAIDDAARQFIQAQRMFFVATAPLGPAGHLNLSPKGLDTFRILDDNTVAYLDFTGSGVETIAHLKENGRIVIMFCAFDGPPNILRLHGYGRVVEPHEAGFPILLSQFPNYEYPRSIIVVKVERVANSCGFGIPLMKHEGERTQLTAWAKKKGPEGLNKYHKEKNSRSIDGLAGLSESGE